MKPEDMDARGHELRRALVATADLTPFTRRRLPVKLTIAAIATFALAGALTGGAVASATSVSNSQLESQAAATGAATDWIQQQDGVELGAPIVRSAIGPTTLHLAKAPNGANALATSFQCDDKAVFTLKLDGRSVEGTDCTADIGGASAGSLGGLSANPAAHTISVVAPASAGFTIALVWAHIPKLSPSPQETAELSDGIVTRAEDIAAFERYAVCMAALGHSIGDPVDSEYNITPTYAVDGAGVDSGADNRCYMTQYSAVDVAWQTEVENGSQATRSVRECLISSGVKPATAAKEQMAQFDALGKNWQYCNYLG